MHLESSHYRDRDQWLCNGLALSFALGIFSSWLRYLLLAQIQCKTPYCICARTWYLSALKGALDAFFRGDKTSHCLAMWPFGGRAADFGQTDFYLFLLVLSGSENLLLQGHPQ